MQAARQPSPRIINNVSRFDMRILLLFAFYSATAFAALPPPSDSDFVLDRDVQILLKSRHFGFGPVGMTPNIPEGEGALKRILKKDDAIKFLFPVFDKGTPAGKCYALVGFRLLSPSYFESSCKRIAPWNETTIDAVSGCIVGKEKLSDIIHAIRDGRYDDEALEKNGG
jgi:hypothetical protein